MRGTGNKKPPRVRGDSGGVGVSGYCAGASETLVTIRPNPS